MIVERFSVLKRLLAYQAGKFIFIADKYVIFFIYQVSFQFRVSNKEENDIFGKDQ